VVSCGDVFSKFMIHMNELHHRLGRPATFVLCDFATSRDALDKQSPLVPKPMPMARFNHLLRNLLASMGLSATEAGSFTSYSCRRLLPTLADILRLPDSEALKIGNWQEMARGANSSRPQAAPSMATLYAGDKTISAADTKSRVLLALHLASGSLKTYDFTMDEFRQVATSWTDLLKFKFAASSEDAPSEAICEASADSSVGTEADSDKDSSSSDDSIHPEGIPWFTQPKSLKLH
jgi:hypothetical protein